MAVIDIFNIQPTQLCKSLSGKFVFLYGSAKTGKTSTAVLWPKPLLLATEKGKCVIAPFARQRAIDRT